MGKFRVIVSETAITDIAKHKKSENKASINKIEKILVELEDHPYLGIGQSEQLKHNLQGFWSRRINQKDRMIYSVNENTVIVEVVSAMGHYADK